MANPLAYPFQSLGYVTVAAAGTPQPMSATSLKVRGLTASAFKAKGTPNVGANAYILDAGGNVLFTIPKGQVFPVPLSHPQLSEMIDLSNLYVDVDTNGDALQISALI